LDLFLVCAMFVAGLAFGSFLNVCISRVPCDLSIVSPPSFCPRCRASILWRDNIPLLSWIMLRGRCRKCGLPISLRYPAVELLTAVLFAACYTSFGFTWLTVKFCVFCFLVVGLTFMDAETGLLPHEFTYPGIVLGLVFAWIVPGEATGTSSLLNACGLRGIAPGPELSVLDSVLGALLGAGFFYLAWALYYLARRRHGMGFGDIALIAMIGTFLGLKLTVLVIFFAPIMATLFAVVILAANPSTASDSLAPDQPPTALTAKSFLSREIPFGVFLGTSSLIALFFGRRIWEWYLGLFH
jgi:leader peptidase (prepilin peptidase)/N-methyltransferase